MFVKADRINERIQKARTLLKGKVVTQETIDDFVKTVEIIVNDELTEKGVERKWTESSQKQENLNIVYLQDYTKEHTSWLKTLMMNLRLWK